MQRVTSAGMILHLQRWVSTAGGFDKQWINLAVRLLVQLLCKL